MISIHSIWFGLTVRILGFLKNDVSVMYVHRWEYKENKQKLYWNVYRKIINSKHLPFCFCTGEKNRQVIQDLIHNMSYISKRLASLHIC